MPPVNKIWGATVPEGTIKFITTPSGQTCHAKRIGLQGMVEAGVLGDSDSLTAMVDSKHIRRVRGGKGPDREELDLASIMKDPDQLGKIIMMVDRALPLIVQSPEVKLHFTDESDGSTLRVPDDKREEEDVYTDQIGLEDKMFLFNWSVGGSADVTRFREESDNAVAGLEHGKDVPRSAKRSSRNHR
jgi:hypothetical protein